MKNIKVSCAVELFLLGQEIEDCKERLDEIYEKGCSLDSRLFSEGYEELSSLAMRFMLLERAYHELDGSETMRIPQLTGAVSA